MWRTQATLLQLRSRAVTMMWQRQGHHQDHKHNQPTDRLLAANDPLEMANAGYAFILPDTVHVHSQGAMHCNQLNWVHEVAYLAEALVFAVVVGMQIQIFSRTHSIPTVTYGRLSVAGVLGMNGGEILLVIRRAIMMTDLMWMTITMTIARARVHRVVWRAGHRNQVRSRVCRSVSLCTVVGTGTLLVLETSHVKSDMIITNSAP